MVRVPSDSGEAAGGDSREIIVASDVDGFRVTVTPPMLLDSPDRRFTDRGQAMTFARLVRLEHGFKIVELPPRSGAR